MKLSFIEKTFSIYICFLLVLPLFIKTYWLHVMILGNIYAILAITLDLLLGYTGMTSFAHAGIFGLGAYTSAIFSKTIGLNPWISLLIACLITVTVGTLFSFSISRVKGHYFAICTLGLNQIIWLIMLNWYEVTRGMLGFYGIPPYPGIPYTKESYYYLSLGLLLLTFFALYKLVNSPIGFRLKAVRDDEDAAQALGINVPKYKVISFAISSLFIGAAGSIYAHFHLLVAPETCHLSTSTLVIAMVIIGGKGTLIGPFLIAYFIQFMTEYLRIFSPYYRMFMIGTITLVIIKYAPGGVLGLIRDKIIRPRLLKRLELERTPT